MSYVIQAVLSNPDVRNEIRSPSPFPLTSTIRPLRCSRQLTWAFPRIGTALWMK